MDGNQDQREKSLGNVPECSSSYALVAIGILIALGSVGLMAYPMRIHFRW